MTAHANPHDPVFLARRYEAHALLSEHHTATLFEQHDYAEALREAYWLRASGQERFWWEQASHAHSKLARCAARMYSAREIESALSEYVGVRHLYELWADALRIRKEEDRGMVQGRRRTSRVP